MNLEVKVREKSEEFSLGKQREYIAKCKEIISIKYKDSHLPMAYVHSYGCQQNVSDGEKIKGILSEIGYGFTDGPENADVVIFNTCAVREHAENRVFGNVGALKKYKKSNPNLIIGLAGCMMQQESVANKVRTNYPFVDMVFGTHALDRFSENFHTAISHKKIMDLSDGDAFVAEGLPIKRDGNIKAWIPIMNGCDNFCSYCIVPYVRGREKSRDPEIILNEIKALVNEGFKEFTLLGQNVNSYGKGLDCDINFSKLLRRINDIEGRFRVRFMTSHPKDATKELIDTIAQCDKICNHLHLPVQSGNTHILGRMRRRYTRESYLELANYAKEKIPDIGLSSDIIVGFPGETHDEFLDTLSLINLVRYDTLFTFIYSRRSGTDAAEYDDPVIYADKSKWFTRLLNRQKEISYENNQNLIGKTVEILVDGLGKGKDGTLQGRTEGNVIVEFATKDYLMGQFVNITITEARNWSVFGKINN